jgi:hypothetical protein
VWEIIVTYLKVLSQNSPSWTVKNYEQSVMFCLPPASRWLLAWLTLRPWRWRQHVAPKCQWTCPRRQHGGSVWNSCGLVHVLTCGAGQARHWLGRRDSNKAACWLTRVAGISPHSSHGHEITRGPGVQPPVLSTDACRQHLASQWLLFCGTVGPERQPLLGNGSVTRKNVVTVGSGVFCAVCAETI